MSDLINISDPGDESDSITQVLSSAAPEPPIELIITDDGIFPVKAV